MRPTQRARSTLRRACRDRSRAECRHRDHRRAGCHPHPSRDRSADPPAASTSPTRAARSTCVTVAVQHGPGRTNGRVARHHRHAERERLADRDRVAVAERRTHVDVGPRHQRHADVVREVAGQEHAAGRGRVLGELAARRVARRVVAVAHHHPAESWMRGSSRPAASTSTSSPYSGRRKRALETMGERLAIQRSTLSGSAPVAAGVTRCAGRIASRSRGTPSVASAASNAVVDADDAVVARGGEAREQRAPRRSSARRTPGGCRSEACSTRPLARRAATAASERDAPARRRVPVGVDVRQIAAARVRVDRAHHAGERARRSEHSRRVARWPLESTHAAGHARCRNARRAVATCTEMPPCGGGHGPTSRTRSGRAASAPVAHRRAPRSTAIERGRSGSAPAGSSRRS